MVMDYIRRCRRSAMRTIHGADPVPVVWFRAPAGAKLLEGVHPWGNRDWADKGAFSGIGEQEPEPCCTGKRPTVWYSGREPAHYEGLDYCGTERAMRFGATVGVDSIFATNVIGQAPCCATDPGWIDFGPAQLLLAGAGSQHAIAAAAAPAKILVGADGLLARAFVAWPSGGAFGIRHAIGVQARAWVHRSAGGLRLGGSGYHAVVHQGEGGLRLAGDGLLSFLGVHESQTELLLNGSQPDLYPEFQFSDGGLSLAGEGDDAAVSVAESEGGLLLGGEGDDAAVSVAESEGGVLLGGEGEQYLEEEGGETCDPGDTFELLMFEVSGGSPWDDANGVYSFAWSSGSTWSADNGAWDAALVITLPTATLTFTNGADAALYDCASFDCMGGNSFDFSTATGGSWPATLTF